VALACITFFVAVSPAHSADPTPNLSAVTSVREWRLTFYYKLDDENGVDTSQNEVPVEGWESRNIEISGQAIFSSSGNGTFLGRSGQASYDYHTASEARGSVFEDEAMETGVSFREDGRGAAKIDDTSTLDFDLDAATYSFMVVLGGEDGVEITADSSMDPGMKESIDRYAREATGDDNLTDTTQANTEELVKEIQKTIPFQQEGDAMKALADVGSWFKRDGPGDDRAALSVQVDGYPLPFFGATMGGTATDYEGALLAWKLEPVEPDTGETLPAESWVHYHPRDAETRREVVSMGEMLSAAQAPRTAAGKMSQFRVPLPPAQTRVYLFDSAPGAQAERVVCGDALVPVDVGSGHLEQRWPREAEPPGEDWDPGYSPPDPSWETPDDSLALTDRLRHLFFTVSFPNPQRTLFNPLEAYLGLTLIEARIQGGGATVYLEGPFEERTTCDRDRIAAQIEQTCRLGESLRSVTILRNGEPF
jgi:hypothetical protein